MNFRKFDSRISTWNQVGFGLAKFWKLEADKNVDVWISGNSAGLKLRDRLLINNKKKKKAPAYKKIMWVNCPELDSDLGWLGSYVFLSGTPKNLENLTSR